MNVIDLERVRSVGLCLLEVGLNGWSSLRGVESVGLLLDQGGCLHIQLGGR